VGMIGPFYSGAGAYTSVPRVVWRRVRRARGAFHRSFDSMAHENLVYTVEDGYRSALDNDRYIDQALAPYSGNAQSA
jgi:hypothetical protein